MCRNVVKEGARMRLWANRAMQRGLGRCAMVLLGLGASVPRNVVALQAACGLCLGACSDAGERMWEVALW